MIEIVTGYKLRVAEIMELRFDFLFEIYFNMIYEID